MKTCNFWTGLSIAHDDKGITRSRSRAYLNSEGGRFNYLWFFQNQRDGIEDRVSLEALKAGAFKQRKIDARQPNWNRIQAMRRLYKGFRSKCSDAYVPDVDIAAGFVQFQPLVLRQDLDTNCFHLVIAQARRAGIDLKSTLPMAFYCARALLLTDAREQLLPTTAEELINVEVADLGCDDPRDLRYLREARIYEETDVAQIEPARAEQRLHNLEEVWPEEVARHSEQMAERRREQRKRNDPWPRGSLFNPDK